MIKPNRTHLAAGGTILALGALTAVAIGAQGESSSSAAKKATTAEVRTVVVKRTVNVTKHRKPENAAAGGSGATSGASPSYSSGAPATVPVSSSPTYSTPKPAPVQSQTSGYGGGENEEDDDEKPDFLKKKVDEADEDDDEKKDVNEDEHDDMEAKEKQDIMAVLDREAEDGKKDMKESLKISIKMPKASLFESAGFNVKQQKKVASIFESAIKSTTRQVTKQIHEHYRKVHVRRLAEAQRRTENRLNTYLDVVVEEWVKTNQVAVRTSLRTELSENFLNGLQKLFTEHYIDVPKSKTDVVKALTRQVETLKRQVNEQYTEKLKLRQLAETANKKRIVATFARDMSEAQAGKLEKLAEDTQYVSAKDFREKLTMLKESYFEKPTSRVTRLPDENVQEVTDPRGPKGEADMVADAITRQAKSSDW